MASNYFLGTDPIDQLGASPRYWYALRKNVDGELFLVRSDQLTDQESYELNIPGPSEEDYEEFEAGVDYLDGLTLDHEFTHDNLKYPQYKWDDRSLFYYVNDEGMFVQRINRGYTYPTGISS